MLCAAVPILSAHFRSSLASSVPRTFFLSLRLPPPPPCPPKLDNSIFNSAFALSSSLFRLRHLSSFFSPASFSSTNSIQDGRNCRSRRYVCITTGVFAPLVSMQLRVALICFARFISLFLTYPPSCTVPCISLPRAIDHLLNPPLLKLLLTMPSSTSSPLGPAIFPRRCREELHLPDHQCPRCA